MPERRNTLLALARRCIANLTGSQGRVSLNCAHQSHRATQRRVIQAFSGRLPKQATLMCAKWICAWSTNSSSMNSGAVCTTLVLRLCPTLHGHPVRAILANQWHPSSPSSRKKARTLSTCLPARHSGCCFCKTSTGPSWSGRNTRPAYRQAWAKTWWTGPWPSPTVPIHR